jgi:hypothetical protein
MNNIKECLQKQEKEIESIISYADKIFQKSPNGTLRTCMTSGIRTQFYLINEHADTQGKYLGKKDEKLIRELAQKEYAQKLLKEAYKKQRLIKNFSKAYLDQDFRYIYKSYRGKTVYGVAL